MRRRHGVVRVEEEYPRCPGGAQAGVACRRGPRGGAAQHLHGDAEGEYALLPLEQHCGGAVGRGVVDKDEFEIAETLRGYRLQGGADDGGAVEHRHHYAEQYVRFFHYYAKIGQLPRKCKYMHYFMPPPEFVLFGCRGSTKGQFGRLLCLIGEFRIQCPMHGIRGALWGGL